MRGLREGDLLWVERPPGGGWPGLLADAWAAGAAVLPVDHRLPAAWVRRLRATARPTALVGDRGGLRRLPGGLPAGEGVRLVIATSGTTAGPKLVEHTARGLEAALLAGSARLGATAADPWVGCLPVAHMGGMLVVARAALWGWPVGVHDAFDPSRVADAVARGARFISVVPTMLARLLDGGVDLSHVRALLVGGSSFDPALRRRAAGARVVHTYGLTESCGGVAYDGVALDGVTIRVESPTGEVRIRAPQVMRGYRLDERATGERIDPDGWLRTGDSGRLVDGRLTVDGRLDDVIITGGEKVWPSQVEAALRADRRVADVQVVGRPDDEWGERVEAIVVPADPSAPPTLDALRSQARDRLPPFALPRSVVLVERLDRTPSGKVRRTR
jgi:o-succinylbenzoate---CoA ligase